MLSVILNEIKANYLKRRLLLTSTGFDNPKLKNVFLSHLGKSPKDVRALFIPTAANDRESKSILPSCRQELMSCGIKSITDYNCDRNMSLDELFSYDCIYFAGGSEKHLMDRINKSGFRAKLIQAIDRGVFIIGVSAGSMIFSSSVRGNIPILKNPLEPHCETNVVHNGVIKSSKIPLNLSDSQGVLILGSSIRVIS